MLPIVALISLLAIAAGAWLRFHALGAPSLWLDEIIHFDAATRLAHEPLWRWLTGIEIENGPLYYASLLVGRAFAQPEVSARVGAGVAGLATVVVALRAGTSQPRNPATIFAFLLALSPLHVYYSREGRPYALLMLLTTALLVALLRDAKSWVVIALLVALTDTSATSFPILVTAGVAAVVLRKWRPAVVAGLCAAAIPLLYRGGAEALPGADFPPFTARFFRNLLDSFTVVALDNSHLHRIAYFFLLFAIGGAIVELRRDRRRALVMIAFAILPAAIALAALWKLNHFYAVRYLAASLPGFLLLVATGITALASLAKRAAPAVALLIALLLVREGLPSARFEPFQKLDWRSIAASLARHAHANDAVIASNHWTAACLGFYLRGTSPPLRLFDAQGSAPLAEIFIAQQPRAWLADAGEPSLRALFCRYPIVLGSPLEHFRLHYAPDAHDFLVERSTSAEQRTLPNPAIGFGAEDALYLGRGWGGPEPEEERFAQWAIGREAEITLPLDAPRDRDLVIDVDPVHYPGSPAQRMTIAVNGSAISDLALEDRRQSATVGVPRERWRQGVNILTFTFDHATAPAAIDPKSSDRRQLAARFSRVAVVPHGELAPAATGAVHPIRFNEFLDPLPLTSDRPLPRPLAALVDESDCLDDAAFLRVAFGTIYERRIDPLNFRDFGRMLAKGVRRRGVVRAMITTDEMRRRLGAAPSR